MACGAFTGMPDAGCQTPEVSGWVGGLALGGDRLDLVTRAVFDFRYPNLAVHFTCGAPVVSDIGVGAMAALEARFRPPRDRWHLT